MRLAVVIALAWAAGLGGAATAQDVPPAEPPANVTSLGNLSDPSTERFRFHSETVGRAFVIEVTQVSPIPPAPGARMPVVFVTDNNQFSMLVPAIVRSAPGLFPSMIVVGVGYELEGPPGPAAFIGMGARRDADFTPTADPAYQAQVDAIAQRLGVQRPSDAPLGGADDFLAFIDDELKPFIAARYPADVDDSALIGHSSGGLFVLHALFTSPGSFDRYIAISPTADYDQGVLLREEAALGDVSARLFMAMGGDDLPAIAEWTPRLDAQIQASARPGLGYSYEIFPGETHLSVVPGALMSGLRAVFEPPAGLARPAAPTPPAP